MPDYKMTFDVIVGMECPDAAEDLGESIANIIDAVMEHYPTVNEHEVVEYDVAEAHGEASFTTKISEYGNSLAVNVTRHAGAVGIEKGDMVRVTIRRLA